MTENTKKWLTVAGCLVVCAILVAVIASSFSKDKVTDDLLPPSSSQQGDVVVDPDSSTPPPAESGDDQKPGDNVTVNPETPDASTNTDDGNGADFTGTEQTIQPDPVKPEYTEDELKDPTKTPDGTPVEGTPEPQDHNNVTPPPEQPSTNTSGGLPGFDNVPNAGANQGGSIDSDGDINTQVGIMGYLGGNEQSTHKYISEMLGKETLDVRHTSTTKGRNGSTSVSRQQLARDLMTPDEVRAMDNRYALLFIRGERPVMDEKYDILRHPNLSRTEDGGAAPYVHKLADYACTDMSAAFVSLEELILLEGFTE